MCVILTVHIVQEVGTAKKGGCIGVWCVCVWGGGGGGGGGGLLSHILF